MAEFFVNGSKVAAAKNQKLLRYLRDELHLTSVKDGCSEGACGACTVLIDGKTYDSCIYPAVWIDGKQVTTIEGLLSPDGQLSPVQQAFVDEGAVQCGFCTPGMIMSAKALLDREPHPTREEIHAAMSGNLCRCTGYTKIEQAIVAASETIDAYANGKEARA